MAPAGSDFWALERKNRRQTAVLIAVFIAVLALLGLGLDFLVGDLGYSPENARLVGFPVLTVGALILGSADALVAYFAGAALVLASVRARKLLPDTPKHQMVLDVIREMALAARMPVPRAYIIDDPAPNAFATGRKPEDSVICVTRGLVDEMDREEIQGVVGHEMAHIRDYDVRTMTMVAVLVGAVAMLADFFYFSGYAGPHGGRDDEGGRRAEAGVLVALVVVILAALAPLVSQLIAMAVSRQREYLADASSVEFTRNPRALLRALEHIARTEAPLKRVSRGIAHLFIVSPLEGAREDDEGFFDNLLSTHPPLSRRIARLRALAGAGGAAPEMHGPAPMRG